MTRLLHRWPGLLAAALLIVVTLGGAALSVLPMAARLQAPSTVSGQDVATLAAVVQAAHPGVEEIRRAPSGAITAWWFEGNAPGAAVIDPATGASVASADAGAVSTWLKEFHRALFLGDGGRWTVAVGAAVMLILSVTGAMLVARRMGGWRNWFGPLRGGSAAGRWHTALSRVAVPGLALSAVTGLWMVGATFSFLPDDAADPNFPDAVSGQVAPVADLAALKGLSVDDLRSLTFPAPGDAQDVFTLTTAAGVGMIDQGTGQMVVWQDNGPFAKIWDWVYLLHTGQGAALWGLILGLSVLSGPVLAVTGVMMWLRARASRPRVAGLLSADRAETVILVASEGGTTWGFAATLAKALQASEQGVALAPLSGFAPDRYKAAKRIVMMAATWGDGAAPASASDALGRVAQAAVRPGVTLSVLGFGDSSFPAYCGFAEALSTGTQDRGWTALQPMGRIDRQSSQDFARWGRAFGAAMGLELELNHQPTPPKTTALTLVSRRDYGQAVQAPAAILRFALPKTSLWQRLTGQGFAGFTSGDLLAVVPEGSDLPRFYSLASGRGDGFIEIAVRQHPGGLCSGQLLALQPGDQVRAFVRTNAAFHPDRGRSPLVLIGAGTGIGPLAGFIRAQGARRPVHLWFGARNAADDLLYAEELGDWQAEGRLSGASFAFSRQDGARRYVQDALRADAESLRGLVARGARIMVCGGRDMAAGVRTALDEILLPMGMTPVMLKAEGRYAEDSY